MIHLIGLNENLIEKVDLKDKKVNTSEEEEEEPGTYYYIQPNRSSKAIKRRWNW